MPCAEAGAMAATPSEAAAINPKAILRSINLSPVCWHKAVVASLPICRNEFALRSMGCGTIVFPEYFVAMRARRHQEGPTYYCRPRARGGPYAAQARCGAGACGEISS